MVRVVRLSEKGASGLLFWYIEPMQLQPSRDIIHIKADTVPEKTASGFFIKEDWKTIPPTGTVLAVGPEVTQVKKGDRVVFERYASMILDGDDRLCKESHILGILPKEESDGSGV